MKPLNNMNIEMPSVVCYLVRLLSAPLVHMHLSTTLKNMYVFDIFWLHK